MAWLSHQSSNHHQCQSHPATAGIWQRDSSSLLFALDSSQLPLVMLPGHSLQGILFYTILWIFQRVRGNQRNTSALQTAGCRDTPSRPSKCESIAQDQQTGRGFSIFKRPPGASSREERRQPPFIENTQCHHFIRYQVKKKKGSDLKWKLIRFRNSRFLSLESYYILVTFSPSKPNHHLKTPSPSSSHCCNYQLSWSGRLTLSRAHGKQVYTYIWWVSRYNVTSKSKRKHNTKITTLKHYI